MVVIDKEVTSIAFPMYPASNREHQFYTIGGTFSSGKDWFPLTATAPTGIFQF